QLMHLAEPDTGNRLDQILQDLGDSADYAAQLYERADADADELAAQAFRAVSAAESGGFTLADPPSDMPDTPPSDMPDTPPSATPAPGSDTGPDSPPTEPLGTAGRTAAGAAVQAAVEWYRKHQTK